MWAVYFNGFYARQEFYTLMGLVDSHYNARYAMYILEELGIISRSIHDNGEDIYGLGPSLKQYVTSNAVPIEMVNYYLKTGRGIIGARSIALAKSKAANTASRKRKYNDVKNATNEKDTEDNEAAASNGSESSEAPPNSGSTSAIYKL